MSKSKFGRSTLSGLVESDSEDGQFGGMPTPDSAAENKAPVKKGRGRPKTASANVTKVTKVTKANAPRLRTSGRIPAKAKAALEKEEKGKRTALADKTNQQNASDIEEVDDFEMEDVVMEEVELEQSVLTVKAKPKATKKKAPVGRRKAVKEISTNSYSSVATTSELPKVEPLVVKNGRSAQKVVTQEPSQENVVQETQFQEMEVDADAEEEVEPEVVSRSSRNVARARPQSRHRQPSLQRRRAGSASDTERGDPTLRRKLGGMTKKYETLNVKYQDLLEIGLKEAERNFERLRKQSDEKTNISNGLISALKAEAFNQTALVKDSKSLKKKLDSQATEMAALQAQVTQLNASLAEVQADNKTLSAKLAANRTIAASVESVHTRLPGSAVKATGGIRMMGTAEAASVAQAAQLKEDIYSDLTGLIIRTVKRDTEEDIFDCLQTGRNGTLHFRLAAANEKSANSYEDAQCSYVPQLDPSRDKALVELLPNYLVDEITFPRPQAAKFYARVVKALTEKPA